MRIGLAQINPTVGDLEGNAARILEVALDARTSGARLVIFPELALCGYPPRDLLDRGGFVKQTRRRLEQLCSELPADLAVVLGTTDQADSLHGPALFNAAALLHRGRIVAIAHKRLLPTYDVFDETRYFAEGQSAAVVEVEGTRIGLTICEDVWNDVDTPLRRAYAENPVADCVAAGADVIVNIAASPFSLPKRMGRSEMLSQVAARNRRPLVFVNQVGGNDDLVFDGCSAVYGPDGELWAKAAAFREDMVVTEMAPGGSIAEMPRGDAEAALAALVLGTRDYVRKCGFAKAVVGLSGGIDSSLVACIAARALAPENVLGVAMPTRYSSKGSLRDAEALAKGLGIDLCTIDIDAVFQSYIDQLGPTLNAMAQPSAEDITYENIQARIRCATLTAICNRQCSLLLTTGNKSEIATGYCTLYGDMAGGLAVIGDLPKTFVYDVAKEVNRQAGRQLIPDSILTKPPSAELRPGQLDRDNLPPYDEMDPILLALVEEGQSVPDVIAAGHDPETVRRVAALVFVNEHKRRQMPPALIVTRKAFGPGRRYPIAQRYRG